MNDSIFVTVGRILQIGTVALASCIALSSSAAEASSPNVRMAEIEIDPTQIEEYRAALKAEIETSIRVEPGVLALNAVAEKDNPARIRILEIYASDAAYHAHIESPHFKKYKVSTQQMVKSLKLIEVVPVLLAAKPH